MTPRERELMLLALKELYHASYSVERREECEELMRRIDRHGLYLGNQVDVCKVDPYELEA